MFQLVVLFFAYGSCNYSLESVSLAAFFVNIRRTLAILNYLTVAAVLAASESSSSSMKTVVCGTSAMCGSCVAQLLMQLLLCFPTPPHHLILNPRCPHFSCRLRRRTSSSTMRSTLVTESGSLLGILYIGWGVLSYARTLDPKLQLQEGP